MFYARYKRDLAAAKRRVCESGSRVAETERGPIEYIDSGDGVPVLLVHGVVGGSDQGPTVAQMFIGDGFRAIAVSRFGYLHSSIPEDPSPAAQADLYAALLDTLDIPKIVLVGTSAGSSSSLQFALQHPDRCAGLVLFSMAVPPYNVPPRLARSALRSFFGSDFVFWAFMTYARSNMLRLMGVPRAIQERLTVPETDQLIDLMHSLLPVSVRVQGIMNDICVSNPGVSNIKLEAISAPTLIIHAVDDPMPPFAGAKGMAARIPTARFVPIENGGHLLLGHLDRVRAEIADFVRRQTHQSSQEGI